MKRRVFLAVLCAVLVASIVATPISASAAKIVKIFKVNVEGLRLRTGPGVSTIQKPSLKKGEKVLYWGKTYKAFYYVRTANGRKGYVYKPYVSSYGAVNARQVYYAKSSTKFYKKPSTRAHRAGKLSKKQCVIVYETRGNWAYIKTLSGKGGYVKLSKLKKA